VLTSSGLVSPERLWTHAFPSTELVSAAAAMFTRRLPAWDGREGARWRVVIGPGVVQVCSVDAAKAERSHERDRHRHQVAAMIDATDMLLEHRLGDGYEAMVATETLRPLTGDEPFREARAWVGHLEARLDARDTEAAPGPARIASWSRKSRARMVRTLAGLDYGPLFASDGVPAMLTLTYPGGHLDGCSDEECRGCGWALTATDAAACKRHIDLLKRRFLKAYGRPLIGVWKREFQRRGAPHYHILMVPPRERVGRKQEGFREWVSRTWASIVKDPRPAHRAAHEHAGTGIDYAEGMRARDPKRLAVYFSKHGVYSAKDYQNEAPAAWVESGSVGRFWGVWGLEPGTVTVELLPSDALAVARTMRRWQRANGFRVQREVWRTNTRTGEQRRRRSGVWVGARMRGSRGFVVVNDGAAFGAALARYLDTR